MEPVQKNQSSSVWKSGKILDDKNGFLYLSIFLTVRQLLKIQCPEDPQLTQQETIDRNMLRGVYTVMRKPVGDRWNLRLAA